MMVSCPGCNTRYSVDERKLPARGASLTCRECGKKWKIPGPAASCTPPPRAAVARPSSPPAPEASPEAQESSGSLFKPVSCPKCGHFFVPYASGRAVAAGGSATARSRRTTPRGRILLVEDQNYFAELTREALGDEFETIIAANISDARKLLQKRRFDLVILDLSLEADQDGTQILHALRQRDIPVLIFTARDETDLYGEVWESLRAAGATDILIKGMNVGEDLRRKVHNILPRSRK